MLCCIAYRKRTQAVLERILEVQTISLTLQRYEIVYLVLIRNHLVTVLVQLTILSTDRIHTEVGNIEIVLSTDIEERIRSGISIHIEVLSG